jgi:hypothetical protein
VRECPLTHTKPTYPEMLPWHWQGLSTGSRHVRRAAGVRFCSSKGSRDMASWCCAEARLGYLSLRRMGARDCPVAPWARGTYLGYRHCFPVSHSASLPKPLRNVSSALCKGSRRCNLCATVWICASKPRSSWPAKSRPFENGRMCPHSHDLSVRPFERGGQAAAHFAGRTVPLWPATLGCAAARSWGCGWPHSPK